MKWRFYLGLAAALTLVCRGLSGAELVGKVSLKGAAPPPVEVALDNTCGKMRGAEKVQIFDYAVGKSNALADVVVFLKGAAGAAARTESVVLEQRDCQYTTLVEAAQVNQPVLVRNSDPLMHSVRFKPMVAGNKGASLIQYTKAADLKFTFSAPEPFIEFRSDYQPWVVSYLYVVDTPYFAMTDTNGNYRIPNVPAGNYTVVAQHRLAGGLEKPVMVLDKNATNNFEFEVR